MRQSKRECVYEREKEGDRWIDREREKEGYGDR